MSSLLLHGGLVIDPVHHEAGQRHNLAVRDGRIVAPAATQEVFDQQIDAAGHHHAAADIDYLVEHFLRSGECDDATVTHCQIAPLRGARVHRVDHQAAAQQQAGHQATPVLRTAAFASGTAERFMLRGLHASKAMPKR